VDVLTLTATTDPRTLHSLLAGLVTSRCSETRAEGPLAGPHVRGSPGTMRSLEAMARELDRRGQVYFVHNSSSDRTVAARVRALALGAARGGARADA